MDVDVALSEAVTSALAGSEARFDLAGPYRERVTRLVTALSEETPKLTTVTSRKEVRAQAEALNNLNRFNGRFPKQPRVVDPKSYVQILPRH